jgi:UPF0148 protein
MNESIKKMAELLRSGATMLRETCPVCNSPLFRSEDKVLCANCGKTFSNVPNTASSQPESIKGEVPSLTSTIISKMRDIEAEIVRTADSGKLLQLAKIMLTLLRIIRLLEDQRKPK